MNAQERIAELEDQLAQKPELEFDVRFIAKVAVESMLSHEPTTETLPPLGLHHPHGIIDLKIWIGPGLRDNNANQAA